MAIGGDGVGETSETGLSRFVRGRRVALGMSQSELEARAGLAARTASNVERGRSHLPIAEHRRRLARALDVTHAELLVAAGEVTPEEIADGARALGAADGPARERRPPWVETVAERVRDDPDWGERALLIRAAVWATQEEAALLLAAFRALPESDATKNRRDLGWDEYEAWRTEQDVLYSARTRL